MPGRAPHRVAALVLLATLLPAGAGPATAAASAAGGGLCATLATGDASAPRLAILSAFPAELAPFIAAADVERTVTVDGRSYAIGVLAGVRVVLGLLGIGMVNANDRATSVLANFDLAGLVVSGVAGTAPLRIGDVMVPSRWFFETGGRPYRVNRALFALAALAADDATLDHCTAPPDAGTVCLSYQPSVFVFGNGQTGDPYMGHALPCTPGGDDLFGCDLPGLVPVVRVPGFVSVDMETTAVARVAKEHRVPFLAFRAASDQVDFSQFLSYYHLAARNEAAATMAFLHRLAGLGSGGAASQRICALLARGRWAAAASRLRRHPPFPTAG